jgi:hypothetical protein
LVEYLITLILESYTPDEMMTSLARKYIPRIPTLWYIKRKMYIITLPEVIREGAILWEPTIGNIEDIRSTEEIVGIERLLIGCSIGDEITVLRCTISVDILAILTELIAILETYLWGHYHEVMPTLSYRSLYIERDTIRIWITLITPPLALVVHRSYILWWIYTDDIFPTQAWYVFMEREKVFETQSPPLSLLWTECREWESEFLSSYHWRDLIQESDLSICDSEFFARDATDARDRHRRCWYGIDKIVWDSREIDRTYTISYLPPPQSRICPSISSIVRVIVITSMV